MRCPPSWIMHALKLLRMDYVPVYKLLQELFPQIDDRLLKVTAKEHSNDADAAVEYIVTEFLPRMKGKTKASSSKEPARNLSSFALPDVVGVEPEDQSSLSQHRNGGNRSAEVVIKETADDSTHTSDSVNTGSLMVVEEVCFYDANDGLNQPSKVLDVEVVMDTESQNAIVICDAKENQTIDVEQISTFNPCDADGPGKLCGIVESEELILMGTKKTVETNGYCSNTSCIMLTPTAVNDLSGLQSSLTVDDAPHSDGSSAQTVDQTIHSMLLPTPHLPLKASLISQELETVTFTANNGALGDLKSPLDRTGNTGVDDAEAAAVTSTYGNSRYGESHEEDASPLEMTLARSEQICSIDLLERIIADAKNNKKTLFCAVESVITMMKEVEVRERAAELAKEEAEMGGIDLLTKVAEMKKMLVHAKEANEMHAGEVYGEKAVLATEVQELQSRLRSLSDERDNALAVLDEMSKIMESRIAEADEVRVVAEKEKREKEAAACAALTKQEDMMEKVMRELKILQEAAEENSKLRDFLVDRGRAVDMLQGEISVIFQDVRILKEKFDTLVPFSQSSSQTSCLLASSSGSSPRSLSNRLNLNDGVAVELPGNSTEPMSFSVVQPKSIFEEERGEDDRDLDDMGWECFDRDTELNGLVGDGNRGSS